MKRIGLFGGSFDPFTVAHMAIAEEVLRRDLVDFVVILPTIVDYHRKRKEKWLSDTDKFRVMYSFLKKSPFQDRIMLDFQEVRMRNDGRISGETLENWRFIDTLNRCAEVFPGYELYAIIGTDSLKNFKTWSRWEDILKKCSLIVVQGRDGEKVESDIGRIEIEIPQNLSNVSSSDIRSRFSDVDEYIKSVT